MKVVASDVYSKVRVTCILMHTSDTETLWMGVSVWIPCTVQICREVGPGPLGGTLDSEKGDFHGNSRQSLLVAIMFWQRLESSQGTEKLHIHCNFKEKNYIKSNMSPYMLQNC